MAIRQLEVNLHAVIHGTKEAIRRMRPRGSGHIVNIASVAGRVGYPHLATYSACKHGVVGLSEARPRRAARHRRRVSVVMPGSCRPSSRPASRDAGVPDLDAEEVAAAIVDALRCAALRRLRPAHDRAVARARRARCRAACATWSRA